jgi:Cu/Ag efflux protein CusF
VKSKPVPEVLSGVKEGEPVVVAANFLIDAESNLKAAVGGFAAAPAAASSAASATPIPTQVQAPAAKTTGHQAEGKVEDVDTKAGTVSLAHGAVASLKWPAMTMEFKVANSALFNALKPGSTVAFEFVERSPGEWVITQVKAADPHAGH